MIGILAFLVMGIIAGFIARALVPGRDPMGLLGTLVLGVVGALIGGFIFGGPDDAVGYIGAIVGAVLALLVYKLVTRNTRRTA
ncbi:MAG TPA: GlsB/YeaQ/YmgE family stress response membrane protein [Acidimicrobiales bacterium]|nr:GlsB/YeaQ/YmgE family stress response membrane protein [Acidimicrobiales bacterium]